MEREEINRRIIELLELLAIIPKSDLRDTQAAALPDDLKEN